MEKESTPQLEIVERLMNSFVDLERAIEGAKSNLCKKDSVPAEVISRLSSYDAIIARQRQLAADLSTHIEAGNLSEISRHVNIINALSGMIIDDARTVLSLLANEPEKSEEDSDKLLC